VKSRIEEIDTAYLIRNIIGRDGGGRSTLTDGTLEG
jgi:hypothetical protein